MRSFRAVVLVAAGVLFLSGISEYGFTQAINETVRPLIVQPIDEGQRVTLAGNMHRLARPQFDAGAAPDSLQLDHMFLVLKRTPEQQAQLDGLVQEQQKPDSSAYHQWLTPEQFGARFGPADEDIQELTAWLQLHGLKVEEVHAGKGAIQFSGTAGQVRQTFHTAIHKYVMNGEEHWANTGDPEIPAALGAVVSGIVNLNSFFSRPQHILSGAHPLAASSDPQPAYSIGWYYQALAPADLQVIYNLNPLFQMSITGSGATIGVVGRSNINAQDVLDFRRVFGLTGGAFQVIVNGTNPGDLKGSEELEAVLDSSWAGAMAPGANVTLVVSASTSTADGTLLSEQYIINQNLADVMTESFGTCEADVTASYAQYLSGLAEQAAAEGISYVVSAGDSGSSGCDNNATETVATGPLSVNVLGSTPYTTTVGGTEFNPNAGNGPYWSESDIGAYYESMLKYIPENVWNQSCTSGSSTCGGRAANIVAGGGGASKYFGKPSWQTGVAGIPNDNARDVPDVSLTASAIMLPYLLCIDGGCAQSLPDPSFTGIGGTSAATPAFAGMLALVRQRTGARQGAVNSILYQMAAAEELSSCNSSAGATMSASCVFNDVTLGNNSVPGGSGYGTSNLYEAGTGYDQATGLGSVNATNLVEQWGSGNGPGAMLNPVNVVWGLQDVGTPSSARTVTLTNNGKETLSISSIALTGANPTSFLQSNNCGTTLNAGASCTISVTFEPNAGNTRSASLSITDNATTSPQTVSLSGTGLSPTLTLSAASLNFGSEPIGVSSGVEAVTLRNTSTLALSISSIALTGTNMSSFVSSNTCGATVSAGASCTISFRFVPAAAGSLSAALTVTDNATGSPQSVALSGTGTGPTLTLTPGSLSFGSETIGVSTGVQTVTLRNTGTLAVSISSIALTGTNMSSFVSSNTCGVTVSAGASCTISFRFVPAAAGSLSAALTVTDNATGSPQSVALSGTGTGPTLTLTPGSLSFGSEAIGVSTGVQAVTLRNTGTLAVSISSIALTGTDASSFVSSNTCGTTVSAGASCTISFRFVPAAAGSLSAALTVTDSATGSPQSVSLTGLAVQ